MKNSKKWILPLSLLLFVVLAGVFYTKGIIPQAEVIPSASIKEQLEMMYNGKVNGLSLNDQIYEAKLVREGSDYSVRVDSETGQVLSMMAETPSEKVAAKQEKPKPDDSTDKKIEDPPVQTDPKPVPEKEKPQPETPAPAPAAPNTEQQPAPQQEQEKEQENKPQPPVKETEPQKTVLLTEQQAIQIALQQLNGEVDDVDFVETSEGGYYLIEIEIDVDEGPDEATYQIHAISGKVMSVTWDD